MNKTKKELAWEEAILEIVYECGGKEKKGPVKVREINEDISSKKKLTRSDLKNWTDGRPMYVHHIRSAISVLCHEKRELKHVKWGIYKITDKGIKRISSR
ncbi:MAG: hypothetical protein ABSC55_29200 [Syntrophorhabdales bacterium]